MAALIESARAAREESQRLRFATVELRRAVRTNRRVTVARTEKAAAAAAATRRQAGLALPSPWSGLYWRRDNGELATALVPVD